MANDGGTANTTEICRQMDVVRRSLGDEVHEIVDSARALTDWKFYVQKYPWLCLAGAAAIGFCIVPTRLEIVSPSAEVLEELAKRNKLVVEADPKSQARGSIGGTLFSLLANAAIRGAAGYVAQNASKLLAANEHVEERDAEPNHR